MKKDEFLNKYWNYYLTLEEKVIHLQKYIEFEKENEPTFSNEIMGIYISICCEIDVLFKMISSPKGSSTIADYKEFICKDDFYSQIIGEKVSLLSWGKMVYQPFETLNFEKNSSPEWWKNYNEVKHSRIMNDNYHKANLKNLLMSLGALYLLEIYYYNLMFSEKENIEEYNIPRNKSKIFVAEKLKANFGNNSELDFVYVDEWEEKED